MYIASFVPIWPWVPCVRTVRQACGQSGMWTEIDCWVAWLIRAETVDSPKNPTFANSMLYHLIAFYWIFWLMFNAKYMKRKHINHN